jgi:Flp pilus assembly protein CpaB
MPRPGFTRGAVVHLRRLSRSPIFFWAAVVALALLTAGVVGRLVGRARAEAARYGTQRTVAVATHPLDVGTTIGSGDVAAREVPVAFLPDGALATPDVLGRTVVAPVSRGQALARDQVSPWGLRGVAALLPPGTEAVGVPTGAATPPLRKGDVVDVLGTFDSKDGGEPTFPVASGAVVVDVGGDSAAVAVTPDEARRVAFAVAHGAVSVAVTAGPPGGDSQAPPDVAQRAPEASIPSTTRPAATR